MSRPENSVELPGVAPSENEVDGNVVPPLLTSYYNRNDESDEENEDIDNSTEQFQRFIYPVSMPPMVRNVYNIRPRKKTDYVKENID